MTLSSLTAAAMTHATPMQTLIGEKNQSNAPTTDQPADKNSGYSDAPVYASGAGALPPWCPGHKLALQLWKIIARPILMVACGKEVLSGGFAGERRESLGEQVAWTGIICGGTHYMAHKLQETQQRYDEKCGPPSDGLWTKVKDLLKQPAPLPRLQSAPGKQFEITPDPIVEAPKIPVFETAPRNHSVRPEPTPDTTPWELIGLGAAAAATTVALAFSIGNNVVGAVGDEAPASAAFSTSWGAYLVACGL